MHYRERENSARKWPLNSRNKRDDEIPVLFSGYGETNNRAVDGKRTGMFPCA